MSPTKVGRRPLIRLVAVQNRKSVSSSEFAIVPQRVASEGRAELRIQLLPISAWARVGLCER